MGNATILRSAKDIDLGRHGVIEAHAGTGKTYTIVETVLRILQEPVTATDGRQAYTHIRDLLLVTFTEKAAGELRKRIREGIEKRIAELRLDSAAVSTGLMQHFDDCLNNIHESFIGTIHSVCLRLLQTWPFETGVHFRTEIVADAEGLADALRESLRTDWQDEGTTIPWALERLREQGVPLEEKHFGLTVEMAGKLLDRDNTVLDRRAIGGRRLDGLRSDLEKVRKTLDDRKSAADLGSAIESLCSALDKVSKSGALEPDRLEMLSSRVSELRDMCRSNVYDTKVLSAPCQTGRKNIYTKAHHKKAPGLAGIEQLCAVISSHPYCAQLKKKEELSALLPLTLICDAAEFLCGRWLRTKQEKGLVSFQDMLRLMHAAVSGNPKFRDVLRQRLRYGIIDEFQDTSILQWRIFEGIFLGNRGENGPRLFIVGDPKQSIFAFQGADVQSYCDAKSAIKKDNGKVYGLIHNYRSLPEIVDGCNAVFGKSDDGPDWFAFDNSAAGTGGIAYPSEGEGGAAARVPEKRTGKPENPLPFSAVQVMAVEGNAPARRRTMAEWTSSAIRALKGRTITVPDGLKWKNITLDYKDFAVIVEAHRLAGYFLERFQADGIPAVKYKMEGVFQSPVARDLHALLRAVLHPAQDPAPRLAALLTRFFNRHPAAVDPGKDLESCGDPGRQCGCISHALEEWTFLASRQRWSRLFKSIEDRTGVRERLVRLVDGGRHLADLRQVSDYCVEKLCRGNLSLEQLVEHLGRLLAEEESAGQDKNLFMLATDRSSVRVLTMHAAKGLEFPVVFVAPGGSGRKGKGMGTLSWIEDRKQRVMPMVSSGREQLKNLFDGEETRIPPNLQDTQERRRRLYVSLTRAQAMLFVPAQVDSVVKDSAGIVDLQKCRLPKSSPDCDLTPRLQMLGLNGSGTKEIELFDAGRWRSLPLEKNSEPVDHLDPAWVMPGEARAASDEIENGIRALDLAGRICRQTSYTELSRGAVSDRTIDHSHEDDEAEQETAAGESAAPRSPLPGGRQTGDALHLALEEMAHEQDLAPFAASDWEMNELVRKYLKRNGILKDLADPDSAIASAASCIRGALTAPLPLPANYGTVTIAGLPRSDRVPEMEFFLSVSPHWVHGYMDLVFRIKNKDAQHPWRYFVLDWKSDRLATFDRRSVDACIEKRHYDLQATIYSNALDKHLKGVLGHDYDPDENLGGAVYVFLRSFTAVPAADLCHAWTRPASPEDDSTFTEKQISDLIGG
jgi:exodeoxyribonuclease V beta subunit